MAQGLWENDKTEEQGCFTAFFREAPFGNSYEMCIRDRPYLPPMVLRPSNA